MSLRVSYVHTKVEHNTFTWKILYTTVDKKTALHTKIEQNVPEELCHIGIATSFALTKQSIKFPQ